MAGPVAIVSGGCKRKKRRGQVWSRRGGAAAAGSLPESTTLNRVNTITSRISQRKSRTRRREDAAGGEGRWASDENQTSGHSCSQLCVCLALWFSSRGPFPLGHD